MHSSQKELLKDFQKFRKLKSYFDDGKVVASFERGDFSDFRICTLPTHGHYRNMLIRFKLKFNDYPNSKPAAECLSRIFHPNISSSGSICYSMFGNDWKREFTIIDYVNGLLFLLACPNHNDPLNSSCVDKDPESFDDKVQRAALGEKIGGYDYDCCKVPIEVKDSEHLAKIHESLEVFLNRNKLVIQLKKKIENFREKVQQFENGNPEGYRKFMKCIESVDQLFNQVKLASQGGESIESFDNEKFNLSKTICESHLDKLIQAQEIESSIKAFIEKVDYRFSRTDRPHNPIKENDNRVNRAFQLAFPILREGMSELFPLIVSSEESEESQSDENENHIKARELERLIREFIQKCDALFDLERKIQQYMQRVYGRFGSREDNPLYSETFEKYEFPTLISRTEKIYDMYLSKLDGGPSESLDNLRKEIRIVRDIRRTAKRFLELEYEFHNLCNEISNPKPMTSKSDLLSQYVKQEVCTFKLTKKDYTNQRWWRCSQCWSGSNYGCCETCKDTCHKGHRGVSESYRSPSTFFCDCGHDNPRKCKGMKNDYDSSEYEQRCEHRKTTFEPVKREIQDNLAQLHSKINESFENTRMMEMKIKQMMRNAKIMPKNVPKKEEILRKRRKKKKKKPGLLSMFF